MECGGAGCWKGRARWEGNGEGKGHVGEKGKITGLLFVSYAIRYSLNAVNLLLLLFFVVVCGVE